MKHWLQLVAIPNAPSSSSNQELQSLKKRIADLEKARSRSPRRNAQKQLALPSGPQMALPAPSAPAQGQKGEITEAIRREPAQDVVHGKVKLRFLGISGYQELRFSYEAPSRVSCKFS